jgi:hypothetical protein
MIFYQKKYVKPLFTVIKNQIIQSIQRIEKVRIYEIPIRHPRFIIILNLDKCQDERDTTVTPIT